MTVRRFKTRVVLFCAALSAALMPALCGCGGGEAGEPAGAVGVANPISESDLSQMAEETGLQLSLPEEEFTQLSVRRFALDPVMFEADFLWDEGGAPCTFRVQKGMEEKNISGMYYDWTGSRVGDGYELRWNESGQGICMWQEPGLTCCISMSENGAPEVLEQLYLRLTQCRA